MAFVLLLVWIALVLIAIAVDAALLLNRLLPTSRATDAEQVENALWTALWLVPLNVPLILWLLLLLQARLFS